MNFVTVLGREAKALWSGGRGTSLIVIATGWGMLVGTRMIYPVMLPYLQEAFELSLTVAGLLVTILWLCGALGQLPGGMLADRMNERTVLTASLLLVAFAVGLVVTAPTAILLFAATALWGFGHSLYPVARITLLSNIYAERLGSALGVTMATGDIGQTILPPIAAAIALVLAWQAGLGFVIPFLIIVGVILFIILPDQPSTNGSEEITEENETITVREVLAQMRNPAMGFMTLILFLYIFIWQSFTAFYPTYLITIKGLSPTVASILFGFFFAVGVVVKPVAGAAYDRIGMRGSLVGILVPPVVGFALLPVLDSTWSLFVITAFISVMLGTGAVTQSYLAESFSEQMRGTGLGVVRTVTATLGAGGPVVFGVVADFGYFDEGYFVLAVVMAAVVLLTLRMPRA